MKNICKNVALVGWVLSATICSSAFSYDGRGAQDCQDLSRQVLTSKHALDEWNRKARESQGTWQMFKLMNQPYQTSQSLAINGMGESYLNSMRDDTTIQKQSDYQNAVHEYNMNGCTSGGRTVYNR
jgi:hypothetical protein